MTPQDVRLRRLGLRSWRRGTKEMDLILGPFADAELTRMSEADLAAYEALLEEDDQSLYAWVSGREPAPERHAPLIARLSGRHGGAVKYKLPQT